MIYGNKPVGYKVVGKEDKPVLARVRVLRAQK